MDLQKMLESYCNSKKQSGHICQIAKARGITRERHSGTCLEWAQQNKDKALSILQKWYDNQPFIPKIEEHFYYISAKGNILETEYAEYTEDLAFVSKMCIRDRL